MAMTGLQFRDFLKSSPKTNATITSHPETYLFPIFTEGPHAYFNNLCLFKP